MLTQIIAGDALEEVNSRLRTLARLHRSEGGTPPSPDSRRGSAASTNGAKKEADFKEEEEVKCFLNISVVDPDPLGSALILFGVIRILKDSE